MLPRWVDRFIRPSTRAFFKEWRNSPNPSILEFVHGYLYGRWPYLYIGLGTGEHPFAWLFQPFLARVESLARVSSSYSPLKNGDVTFADTYHGKVVPHEEATKLVSVQQEIRVTDLERVIPFARARDIILKNPDHITLLRCPCRASREKPCEPLDVCLIIGEPFAGFMLEHHPEKARRITQAEALVVLREEHERGHVHHAFFKDAMLNRFYAICNCCSCCCGALQAHRHGTPMLASSGYISRVAEQLCIGCGTCIEFCQFGALVIVNGKNHVDSSRCMGCGVCSGKCPHEALALSLEPSRGIPLDIHALMESSLSAKQPVSG